MDDFEKKRELCDENKVKEISENFEKLYPIERLNDIFKKIHKGEMKF